MKNSFFLLLFFLALLGFSQNHVSLVGQVTDSIANKPIEWVNVTAYNKDSILETGTITDSIGKFNISLKKNTQYKIIFSFIGYKTKTIDTYTNRNINDIGNITLSETAELLDEVSIYGNITYERLVDREIITPDSTIVKNATNALDVLSLIPGIKVNRLNNSASILGRENVLILVNDIANGRNLNLSSIDPKKIEKIEIIKNPSSKYNSDYNGVINIVLKKKVEQGLSMNINLNYFGTKHNESFLNLEYGYKDIKFFGNYELYYRNHPEIIQSNIESTTNNTIFSISSIKNQHRPYELGHFFQYGLDYFISKKSILNLTGDYKIIDQDYSDTKTTDVFLNDTKDYTITSDNSSIGKYIMSNYALYYKYLFNKPKTHISLTLNYYDMGFNESKLYNNLYHYTDNTIKDLQKQINIDDKNSFNSAIDFQTTFNKITLEIGYQLYTQKNINSFQNNESNVLSQFNENRNSFYSNLFFNNINKWNFLLGLRLESSNIIINNNKNNNVVLNPNLSIQYKINPKTSYSINYKQYIARPTFEQLKPFEYQIDSININRGNANLIPEKYKYLELSYKHRNKSFLFNSNIYYKNGKDIFGKDINIQNDIRYTSVANIAHKNDIGIQITSSFDVIKKITINPFFTLYRQSIKDKFLENSLLSYSFNLSMQAQISEKIFAGLEYAIPGKQCYLQGYFLQKPSFEAIYIGKQIFKSKGTLMIGASNPFSDLEIDYYEKNANYNYSMISLTDTKMFIVKLYYNFHRGKELNKIEYKSKMENDKN